jgi:5-methylthioribose kinase
VARKGEKLILELLNEVSVLPYLVEQGVVTAGEKVIIEILTGGVSNTVLAVTTDDRNMVLKQALPELKVAEKWEADQRRAIVEADALRLFHELSPKQVPNLVFIDPIQFVLIMDRVELDSTVWKSDLLDGRFDLNVAKVLGETLATWHLYGESNPAKIAQFKEDTLFEQLRVDPFYRFVAKQNPDLQTVIGGLIDELETEHTTIVHGDFSPKNIMVSPSGQVYVLDFEVMHIGNPVFDLAFLVAHLLCKFFRAENEQVASQLAALATSFLDAYEKMHAISPSLALHTALISLARVEGKSPVNYLNPAEQEKLQAFTKSVLYDSKITNARDLFDLGNR